MRVVIVCSVLVSLSFPGVLVARQSAAEARPSQWEKLLGTWKQLPGPDEPTMLKVEPDGGRVKISFGCKQDGSCPDVFVANYDGKPYKEAGSTIWTASFRKTDDGKMEEDDYSSGTLASTEIWKVSPEGETLTRTYHSIDLPGSKDTTNVYDRSGGPVSKEDPFAGYWRHNWNKSTTLLSTIAVKGTVLLIANAAGITTQRDCDGRDHRDTVDTTATYSCRFVDE